MHFLFFLLDYSCYILFGHRKLSVRCPLWILPLFHYIVAHFGGLLLFTLDFALSIIKILTLFFFFLLSPLGLPCCPQVFYLWLVRATLLLWSMGSVVVAYQLSCLMACGIFLDQDWTHVPCFSRRTLYHWTTMEGLWFIFSLHLSASHFLCFHFQSLWVLHFQTISFCI